MREDGSKCVCCGEKEYRFLTIDHVNNDGTIHHKKNGRSSWAILKWILENNFPKELQILCYNCNAAKQFSEVCPHQKSIQEIHD